VTRGHADVTQAREIFGNPFTKKRFCKCIRRQGALMITYYETINGIV
jgi:hypothetical protein